MNDNLAPVFLDNKPVSLNDPKPKLSAILSASGRPESTDVKWLQFQANTPGKTVRREEVLDRTADPSKPIYLTSGKGQSGGGQSGAGQPGGGQGQASTGQRHSSQGSQGREGEAGGQSARTPSGNDPRQSGGKGTRQSSEPADDAGMQDDSESGGESGKSRDVA